MTHRILLADDSLTIRKVVELTFSDEDFTIDSVGDGALAIEHARAQRPDIIISDVIMPGLNGYELCQQVKSDPGLQSVPFLFLKGTFESFDEEKARSCGSDGFIVKPFESQEMIAKVRGMIAAAAAAPAPTATRAPVPPPVLAAPGPVVQQREAVATPSTQQRPTIMPPPIPTIQSRPAPVPPATPSMAARPVLPIPPRPVRPVPLAPPAILPPSQPPVLVSTPAPPPPTAPTPIDEFGFDFGDAEGDRFGSLAVQPPVHKAAVSPLEDSGESDEDLWSEVSLRGNTSDLLEERQPAGSGSGPGAEVVELAEEAAIIVPDVLFDEEAVFEEISTARRTPLAPPAAIPVAPVIAAPVAPVAAPPISIDQAEIERIVAARVEVAVKAALESIVGERASTMIEAVAWEVIPDLAEAMIRAEIERVRHATRTD